MWNPFCSLERAGLKARLGWCQFVSVLLFAMIGGGGFLAQPSLAQFNENCFVSILNRTAQVRPDGAWEILNLPSDFGPVRARATCLDNGQTIRGQSDLFPITLNQTTGLQPFALGVVTPIPVSLMVSAPLTILTTAGATTQLTTFATLPDTTMTNVTASSSGTVYSSSNAAIASVDVNGVVAAVRSGAVLMTARNEGAIGLVQLQVQLSGDSDGDGIPDDQELALGLDPNDPLDALEDADQDGLTAAEEIALGTNIFVADTDGDGIADGEEVVAGADGFVTNPLLADTDGDGLRDGLEVATGSDPTDPNSFNLAQALASVQVSPSAFALTFDLLLGEASEQVTVTGTLIDQTTIDLTAATRGTNYTSSDLTICNFGATDGLVFAGLSGNCTITVNNNGFVSTVDGIIQNFAPTALSFVDVPGSANAVDVNQDLAYVANGVDGLQIIDIADPLAPNIIGTYPTTEALQDVTLMGSLLYLVGAPTTAGTNGTLLTILDVSDPTNPTFVGEVLLPGEGRQVVVAGPLAYVALFADGMQVVDISTPSSPRLLGHLDAIDSSSRSFGVAVDPLRGLAVVAAQTGIRVLNIANPSQPVILSTFPPPSSSSSHKIVLQGTVAYIAHFLDGFTVVDLSDPLVPVLLGSLPAGTVGESNDVVVSGNFVFGAGTPIFQNNNNLVRIIDVSDPSVPAIRPNIDFLAFGQAIGNGITADGSYVYLTANDFVGSIQRLYIGQYLARSDSKGIVPTVTLSTPMPGQTITEGSLLPIIVDAADDKSIKAVEFLVDGQVVYTDTTFPYHYDAPVAVGTTAVTVAARAIDLGDNQAQTLDVTVTVQPDLLTTVIGTIVDPNNIPISGAQVITAGGVTGITVADGSFSLTNVPTLFDSSVSAESTMNGEVFQGTSGLISAVPQGLTNIGQLTINPPPPIGPQ